MSLIKHIESELGTIESSWKLNSEKYNIQALKFLNKPFKDTITYCTLGLSNQDLLINNIKSIKQELLLIVPKNQVYYNDEDIASFMLTFAESIVESKKALLRGEVVGPGEVLFKNTKCNSVYCSMPVFFDDNFHVYKYSNLSTVFVWLIPILEQDRIFIKANGWNAFEDLLEKVPDDIFWNLEKAFVGK